MVAIISLCKHRLHEEEFVKPVVEIARKVADIEITRVSEDVDNRKIRKRHKGAIVCGTALKDFDYLQKDFSWLLDFEFVLGICAGYQVLARLFSANISRIERIGVHEVICKRENPLFEGRFRAYFLHELALSIKDVLDVFEVLAVCENEVAAFKVKSKEFYGVSFHPEVLSPEIIEKFVELSSERS